jgi:exopolysaccharide production protein ExoQ
MLYISSKPLAYWFFYSGDPEQGSPLDRWFMILLIFLAILLLVRRRFDWGRAIRANIPLIILAGFMLISIMWSTMLFTSFKRWTHELLAILMAFAVLSEPAPRRAIESIIRRTIYVLIPLSVVLIKYFPQYGIDYAPWSGWRMWIGVTLQKNSLGRLCFVAIIFLVWSLTERRKEKRAPVWKYEGLTELFLIAVSIWLLRGPEGTFFYSAASFYALCLGLLVYTGLILVRKSALTIKPAVLITVALIIIIVGVTALFKGGSNIAFVASTAGRDTSLTGRTEVWAALLPVAMKSPIIGGGFGGFWTPRTKEAFQITGAHNGYLDVLLGLGFIGIVLVSAYYLWSCRKAHALLSVDFYWAAMWICFIMMSLVHNMAESSMDSLTEQLSATILLFTVSSTNMLSRAQKQVMPGL